MAASSPLCPSPSRGGLQLVGVLELPYDDLIGASNDASTTALLTALWVSLGMSVAFSILIGLILRPLSVLAGDMDEVAWMNLDGISKRTSGLYEIAWMQRSFMKMVDNLVEYRQYLPEAVLNGDDGDEDNNGYEVVSGRETLVFSDIRGSTACWDACPEGMRVGLRIHNTSIRELIQTHQGYEVKTIGDAFMVSFKSPKNAVDFALAVQERLNCADWPAELLAFELCQATPDKAWAGLRLRIGVHHGDVDVETNLLTSRKDYYGTTVNKASRLESNCIPGAVAVSQELLDEVQLDGTKVIKIPMGKVNLKGLGATSVTLLLPSSLEARKPIVEKMIRDSNNLVTEGKGDRKVSVAGSLKSRRSSGRTSVMVRTTDRFKEKLNRVTSGTAGRIDVMFTSSLVEDFDDPVQRVSDALTRCFNAVQRTTGSIAGICGTALFVGWNINRTCYPHVESCLTCASMLYQHHPLFTASVGLCTGMALYGNVGGGGHRYVTMLGPCVHIALQLSNAALELGTTCLYVSLNGAPLLSDNSNTLRPICEWAVQDDEKKLVIYEGNETSAPDHPGFEMGGVTSSAWGWSNDYSTAFFQRNAVAIREHSSGDPCLARVVSLMEEKKSLLPPLPSIVVE